MPFSRLPRGTLVLAALCVFIDWKAVNGASPPPPARACTANDLDVAALLSSNLNDLLPAGGLLELGGDSNIPGMATYSVDCDQDGLMDLLLLLPNVNANPYFLVLRSSTGCRKDQGPADGWTWASPENCPAFFGVATSRPPPPPPRSPSPLPLPRPPPPGVTSTGRPPPPPTSATGQQAAKSNEGIAATTVDTPGDSGADDNGITSPGGAASDDSGTPGGAGSDSNGSGSGSGKKKPGFVLPVVGSVLGALLAAAVLLAVVAVRRSRASQNRVLPLLGHEGDGPMGRRIAWPRKDVRDGV